MALKDQAVQEYGPQHPITRKLAGMHEDVQTLLQENLKADWNLRIV